ncbi:MAG: peptidylprolyl isomerase [Rhodospirillales bacterium]|nr:peptidylprolyl isomerase [Rhodospirillales bacterium]
MNPLSFSAAFVIAVGLAAAPGPVWAQQGGPAPAVARITVEGIAAIVNDEPISRLDLDHRLRFTLLTSGLPDTAEIRRRLIPDVIQGLIDERLKAQEAKRLGIKAEKAEVESILHRMEAQSGMSQGGMKAYLDKVGIALGTLTARIESDIVWRQIVTRRYRRGIRISDEEVDEHLARIRANAGKPQSLAAEIFIAVEDPSKEGEATALAARLVDQIRRGVPFRAIAQNFSQSPSAAQGGDLGWVSAGQLEPAADQALATLQPGQITPPVRGENGYYILMLRERRAGSALTDSEPMLSLHQVLVPLPPNPTPAQLRVQLAQTESLVGDAKSCADMERAAKASGSPMSGSLGTVKLSSLPAETRALVENLPVNTPSQALQAKDAFIVMMVCKREVPTAAAEERQRVLNMLVDERLQLGARQYLRDLRRAAFVDVRV